VKLYELCNIPRIEWLDRFAFKAIEEMKRESVRKTDHEWIQVNLPTFDLPIVFHEVQISTAIPNPYADDDMVLDNLVEGKHRKLIRGGAQRYGHWDRELKPNAALRDEINVKN
jgi:phosphatidylinositol 3-kinase